MIAPRRFLPSISSLLALEAVERLGSTTAAAKELSLTHSAISRQLKVVEEQLGVTLMRRDGRGLTLTTAGTDYTHTVRDCLNNLARASLRIRASGSNDAINLAILPSFGKHWLTPRLAAFHALCPNIMLHLSTRLVPFDFNHEPFDAAIHYGAPDWQNAHHLELATEQVIPVCAPHLLKRGRNNAASLLDVPLLHLESRPGAWEEWFTQQGVTPNNLRGMLFDQFETMAAATRAGLGMALLPDFIARPDILNGRLSEVLKNSSIHTGSYFLVWPTHRQPTAALKCLTNWFASQPQAGVPTA